MKTLVTVLLVSSVAFAAEPRQKLAVLDLTSTPDTAGLASAVSAVVANEVQRLGVFDVYSSDQVRTIVGLERQKTLLGVESDNGLQQLGETLASDFVISGAVRRIKGSNKENLLSLELNLLDVKKGSRVSSEIAQAKSEGELVNAVAPLTVRLCGKVLSGKTGTLYVSSLESGASVKIDDTLKGVTPLSSALELPAGPHLLTVEKDGFVTAQKEVRVKPGEHVEEQISMVPSPDFIQAYEAKASRMRVGAYIASGVAVAGVASAGYFQYRASQLFGSPEKAGTFAYHQALVNQGIETDESGDHRAAATSIANEIKNAQTLTWVGAGAAAAGAVTATWLFVAGDSPGKYNRYEVRVAGFGLAPTRGGAVASLGLQF